MPQKVRTLENYIIQINPSLTIPSHLSKKSLARHLLDHGGQKFNPQEIKKLWIWTGPVFRSKTPHYLRRQFYAYIYHTYRYPEIPIFILQKRAIFKPQKHHLDVNPYHLKIIPRQRDVSGIVTSKPATQDELDLAEMLLNYSDDPEMLEQLSSVYTTDELDKARLLNQLKGL